MAVGIGKGDITGPVVQVAMMGYADPRQKSTGYHSRLFARCFWAQNVGENGFVFCSLDNGMGALRHKRKVVESLNEQGIDLGMEQLIISGTHTHSGPAGYFEYFTFQIPSSGFIQDAEDSMVSGTVDAIKMAFKDASDQILGLKNFRNIKLNHGQLFDANLNRSPSSYLKNPQELIDFYPEGDTDKNMTLIGFYDSQTEEIVASFNWFAVHPVAMNKSNTLINGCVKGWPSKMMEDEFGEGFVGAFAATNLGDVSPNTDGHKCHYKDMAIPEGAFEGMDCEFEHSLCPVEEDFIDRYQHDMKAQTDNISKFQFAKAQELLFSQMTEISSTVSFQHRFINMAEWKSAEDPSVKTCIPAMGVPFGAGCTDGHGASLFEQGINNDFVDENLGGEDWVWFKIRDLLKYECHGQKAVLLPTGWADIPYLWHPHVVELGLYRIGEFFIISVPGEFSTMAGRKIREALRQEIRKHVDFDPFIVIAGLSNIYTHYITTVEEYNAQRYEAGSVIYGENTLQAYTEETICMAREMLSGETCGNPSDPPAEPITDLLECLERPGVDTNFNEGSIDFPPGSILKQPNDLKSYFPAQHEYRIEFQVVGANPRNLKDLDHFWVENADDGKTAFTGNDWETEFSWELKTNTAREEKNRQKTKMEGEEFDKFGVLAGVNNFYGMVTGRKIDFEKAIQAHQEGKILSENIEDITIAVEEEPFCPNGSVKTDGASLITISLIFDSDRRPVRAGNYRICYRGNKRDEKEYLEYLEVCSRVFSVSYA
ncbi:unnamed protein product [Oikopleura dioica]|uniref:Neutral ceramidase n=1 Tax=Oikopleura dioica TaxID=34765 RepID=E4YE07_OIKDI|nr:unnamed protein product [Oikopleura dioica]